MASNTKPRQPRLRASCDGCFIAKVKCSKARPICSRCLACGLECRYSPSSRAGKPKSDNNSPSSHQAGAPPHLQMANLATIPDDRHMLFQGHPTPMGLYRLDTGWNTPQSLDGSIGQSVPMGPDLSALGLPANPGGRRVHDGGADMYGVGMSSWGSEADMSTPAFADFSMAPSPLSLSHSGRTASMDTGGSLPMVSPWADAISSANTPTHEQLMAYETPTSLSTPASMGSAYFPSPSVTPNLPHRHRPASVGAVAGTGSCACFSICLQSLQALHNASAPTVPPFDVVLSLNRKAVDGCAAMLTCPRCMHRSGTHTAAMLLATVMGKVTSFYKSTSQLYFEDPGAGAGAGVLAGFAPAAYREGPGGSGANPGLGVSLGAYKLGLEEGRWLELEILSRELRKLEEVYTQFREVCAELSDDAEVTRAMIGYLNHTLGTTLEVVKHRQGQGQGQGQSQGGMQCA